MSTPKRPWNGTVPQILIGLLLAGLIVAVIEANSDYDEDCGWSFIGTTVAHWGGGDHHRIRIGRGRCRVDLELEGEIDFAADNRGVERLGSGASLSIKERRRGETRRLDVERGRDGQPVYSWWVGRVPRDFDDEARAWLADTLPRLYRTTGLDADGRVEALWAAGGFDAVAAEIRELDSDHVRVLYLRELLARSTADDELVGALDLARREVSSDYEMGRLLGGVGTAKLGSERARAAWAAALRTIDSDYQLRSTLSEVLMQPEFEPALLDPSFLDTVLDAAGTISSDHEQAELLIEVARRLPEGAELPASYARALESVGADYEQTRVLEAAVVRRTPSAAEAESLLATATAISSDSVLAELLAQFARAYPPERPLPASFFTAAATIDSDYSLRQTLAAVVDHRRLDPALAAEVLGLALSISSDHELSTFLEELIEAYPRSAALPAAFAEALETIDSRYEREKLEQALEERPSPPTPLPGGPEPSPPTPLPGGEGSRTEEAPPPPLPLGEGAGG